MNWKNILRLVLGALLPGWYLSLKTLFPDFPLQEDAFLDLVLWGIAALIGGWNLHNLKTQIKTKGLNTFYWMKSD